MTYAFFLGLIKLRSLILDVDCGAGFDLIFASHLIGSKCQGCALDLTPQMAGECRESLTVTLIVTLIGIGRGLATPYPD